VKVIVEVCLFCVNIIGWSISYVSIVLLCNRVVFLLSL